MNLWQLRVFKEIMDSGSISTASRNLFRTQSAISSTLAKLEEELGYELFIRQNRRLHPIPEAYFLLEEAKDILERVRRTESMAKGSYKDGKQRISIACGPLLAEFLMPRVIQKFCRKYPEAEFSLSSMRSSETYHAVAGQRCNIGLAACNSEGRSDLVSEERFHLECYCAVSENDPLAARSVISPRDLDGKPCVSFPPDHHIAAELARLIEASGGHYYPKHVFQTSITGLRLIADNQAYGVFNPLSIGFLKELKRFQVGKIKYIPMNPTIEYRYALITPALKPLSKLATEFYDALRAEVSNILADNPE